MSIIIKYKNLSGEQITSQQAQNIKDYYFKEEYDGNLDLRKRISYDQGEIFHVIHYLKNDEDFNNAIIYSSNQYGGGGFYFNKQIINGYTSWDIESYENMTKVDKAKKICDATGRTIAYQKIDIHTNEIINTKKYFYLDGLGSFFSEAPPIPDNGRFDFSYDDPDLEPGEIFVVINLMLYMDVGGGGFNIGAEENIFFESPELASVFTWEDHPYYHSASPLIPNITIV
ncbi:hypothetical protein [Pedobacter sp. GR22-10]|uniref:hypothetical protein n=1 Tax=Pedobacter sp. GR22-10 TaxID=2994472 RepID=UPI0022484511|nr:hypothetical protein [Pedobacter sp. GR22-10]MCX2431036.1 hypothetical protein [Pedobacter sp. GR22-10]